MSGLLARAFYRHVPCLRFSTLFGEDPGARIEAALARLKDAMGRAHQNRDGLQPASANALGYKPEPSRTLG